MAFLPQVGGLISMFNMGPLRVNRPGLPTQDPRYGDYPDADPVEFDLNPVHVQPLEERELEQLNIADTHREAICVFTNERMFVGDDGEVADRLEYEGRSYRLVKRGNWARHGFLFCSVAQLEDCKFDEENC